MKYRRAGVEAAVQDQELGPCLVGALAGNRDTSKATQQPELLQLAGPLCSRGAELSSGAVPAAKSTSYSGGCARLLRASDTALKLWLGPRESMQQSTSSLQTVTNRAPNPGVHYSPQP